MPDFPRIRVGIFALALSLTDCDAMRFPEIPVAKAIDALPIPVVFKNVLRSIPFLIFSIGCLPPVFWNQ
jgi:hypothetical protein